MFERSFIPFELTSLAGESALVLAPHPDDEIFGCGGTIALHRQHGDLVSIIFLTDGALAQQPRDKRSKSDYAAARQTEARAAAKVLGVEQVEFWDQPDRGLHCSDALAEKLAEVIRRDQPGIVYAPSLHEFHPDHRNCARLAWSAVARANHRCRLAFYEVNRPFKVNTLVDISAVVKTKRKAGEAYRSQLGTIPYVELSLSLNRFRALTVAEAASHVEAFDVVDSTTVSNAAPDAWLLEQFFAEQQAERGVNNPLVSVVVRTKNRPRQLEEALQSLAAQSYRNIEAVVVNDGGQSVREIAERFADRLRIKYVHRRISKGRSRAANRGFQECEGQFIALLDDDDLLYPNHIAKLVAVLEKDDAAVAYSDVDVRMYRFVDGQYIPNGQKKVFADRPFSRRDLLKDNFIPVMSVLFDRKCLDHVGGFDESLEQFEDWDFWIRVSAHFDFVRVPGSSSEYRLLMERLQYKQRIQTIDARLAIYRKHAKDLPQTDALEFSWQQIHALEAALEAYKS